MSVPTSTGQRIGYIRVSTIDQNPARQLEGVELDRVFTEYASGRDTRRPELDSLCRYARDGDTVVVHSMDRLARNLDDLRRLVRQWTEGGIRVVFVTENLTFTDAANPMSTLLLSMMGAFAEFERAIIRERQREGIEIAKRKGLYRGRKGSLTPADVDGAREQIAAGVPKTQVAKGLNVSRETLYKYLRGETAP